MADLAHDMQSAGRTTLEVNECAVATGVRTGKLDALMNHAGISIVGPLENMSEADYEAALATHLWAPLRYGRGPARSAANARTHREHFVVRTSPSESSDVSSGQRITRSICESGMIETQNRAASSACPSNRRNGVTFFMGS